MMKRDWTVLGSGAVMMAGLAAVSIVVSGVLVGCAGTSIAVKERLGYAKREQLVDQVQEARDEQEEAREQFATTLEEFKALTGFDGGDLEKTYNRLKRELERSEDAAGDVSGRIRGIERVADAAVPRVGSGVGSVRVGLAAERERGSVGRHAGAVRAA